jgi:hypothetical protein
MTQNVPKTIHLAPSLISDIDLSIFLRKLPSSRLIAHHYTLVQAIQAFGTFDRAMKVEVLKVIVTNEIMMEKSMQLHGRKSIPFPVATSMDAFLNEDARDPFILIGDNFHVANR